MARDDIKINHPLFMPNDGDEDKGWEFIIEEIMRVSFAPLYKKSLSMIDEDRVTTLEGVERIWYLTDASAAMIQFVENRFGKMTTEQKDIWRPWLIHIKEHVIEAYRHFFNVNNNLAAINGIDLLLVHFDKDKNFHDVKYFHYHEWMTTTRNELNILKSEKETMIKGSEFRDPEKTRERIALLQYFLHQYESERRITRGNRKEFDCSSRELHTIFESLFDEGMRYKSYTKGTSGQTRALDDRIEDYRFVIGQLIIKNKTNALLVAENELNKLLRLRN